MSYQGQDPNQQGQYPNSGSYSGYNPQPQPTDPYSGQQYGQQGAYGQQQQPYGQQQFGGYQQPDGPTSSGLSPNVAAGLSYLFGWIGGLIFVLVEKQNRFVRFSAVQSLLFAGSLFIIQLILGFLQGVSHSGIFSCLVGLVGLAFFIGWLFCWINAFQGKQVKLPYIGDVAERYVDTGVFKL